MINPRQQGGIGQGGRGGQGSPNQGQGTTTTTTSSQSGPTTTSRSVTSSTPASSHTTTSSLTLSSTSSGTNKGAIIGGIVGGIGGLLILSLLGVWLLQRRKQRQLRNGKTQPVTYTGLNGVFGGIPFNRSAQPPPLFQPSTNISYSGAVLRGGATSLGQGDGGHETDRMLPTYAESQLSIQMASQGLSGHLNTSYDAGSDSILSPLSSRDPNEAHIISPQTTGASYMVPQQTGTIVMISPQTTGATNRVRQHTRAPFQAQTISPDITGLTYLDSQYTGAHSETHIASLEPPTAAFLVPQHTRDTMGFPVDDNFEEIRLQPETAIPIVSPVPRHPLVHQDSLERVVRQGMSETPTPVPSTINPNRLRVLSQEMPRESPVLGGMNPVRMVPQPARNETNAGLDRNLSQRTVNTVSSIGISVVSDRELERLGVGSRGNHL